MVNYSITHICVQFLNLTLGHKLAIWIPNYVVRFLNAYCASLVFLYSDGNCAFKKLNFESARKSLCVGGF
jgi:hypothetical protein